ncbi:MAG: four helix bundle protein [Saprospiraceae bacterium]|nr:four helix bundle protein [Saprospiraceae bacterium]
MATFQRFEDMEIWQLGRDFAREMADISGSDRWHKQFDLIDQIRRSSGSISDNIAEGFERDGNREFIQYLSIAKGSCGETRSQLYRALDRNLITEEEFNHWQEKARYLSAKIAGFMRYLKNSGNRGNKFK